MAADDNKVPLYKLTATYDELPNGDDDLELLQTAAAASATATDHLLPSSSTAPYYRYGRVRDEFRHIMPECSTLTWTDDFFDNDDDNDDIVAVFDLDYDSMEQFYTSLGWVTLCFTLLYPPLFLLASAVALVPCFLRSNVQWAVRAKHVAITRDGIRFVQDRRSCGWGWACMEKGKHSKTVPFDKITDCDIVEPAGNECCCIPRVLFAVRVDTASSSHERHELVLAGLKDPHNFKKLVWAMKRSQQQQRQQQQQQPHSVDMMQAAMQTLVAAAAGGGGLDSKAHANDGGANKDEDIASLLREIRDELRQNNETLQAMQNHVPMARCPSAPSAEAELL